MVSIVVPYYNRPKKIERTLNSIFNQSFKDFEVIVVDDCSDLIFNNENYDIIYIRNNSNLGPGASRNIGKNVANGTYIVFLDSDDYWHEDFLEKTICKLEMNSQAIMCYTNGYNVDCEGKIIKERRNEVARTQYILPSLLLNGRPWGTGGCVWRLYMIKDLQWGNTRCWEDYAFDVSAALLCNEIVFVNDFLIFYDQSISDDKLSNQSQITIAIDKNISLNKISDLIRYSIFFDDKILKNKIAHLSLNNTILLLKNNIKQYQYYKNNINTITMYKNFYSSIIIYLLISINNKLGLRLIRLFRKIF